MTIGQSLRWKVRGKFFEQADPKLHCVVELLRCVRCADSPKVSGQRLRASSSSRVCANAAVEPHASPNSNNLSDSIVGDGAERIRPSIFEYQGNGVSKTLSAFFQRLTLSICTWYLRAVPNEPFSVALDNGSEFIRHG
jgi:hypothetical protein